MAAENMQFANSQSVLRLGVVVDLYSPAAQCGVAHLHDNVGRLFDGRDRSPLKRNMLDALQDYRIHRLWRHSCVEIRCLVDARTLELRYEQGGRDDTRPRPPHRNLGSIAIIPSHGRHTGKVSRCAAAQRRGKNITKPAKVLPVMQGSNVFTQRGPSSTQASHGNILVCPGFAPVPIEFIPAELLSCHACF